MTRTRAFTLVLAALVLGASPGVEGCRACGAPDAADASIEPPMPPGMLVPKAGDAAGALDTAAGVTEVIPAVAGDDDARRPSAGALGACILGLETAVLLHDTFARAKPGFDPFRPHLFDAAASRRLDAELGAFETEWRGLGSAAAARARFGDADLLRAAPDDAAWVRVKSEVAGKVTELRRLCQAQVAAGLGVWVRSR